MSAQSATLTATVRVNPLEIEVVAPDTVVVGEWFDIDVVVSNLGATTVKKTSVVVNKPSGLKVRANKKRIGDLAPGATEIVTWRAKVNSPGGFVAVVEVSGKLDGEEISAFDSITISAIGSLAARFFRLIFGV